MQRSRFGRVRDSPSSKQELGTLLLDRLSQRTALPTPLLDLQTVQQFCCGVQSLLTERLFCCEMKIARGPSLRDGVRWFRDTHSVGEGRCETCDRTDTLTTMSHISFGNIPSVLASSCGLRHQTVCGNKLFPSFSTSLCSLQVRRLCVIGYSTARQRAGIALCCRPKMVQSRTNFPLPTVVHHHGSASDRKGA